MIRLILQSFYYFLPAYAANIAPPLFAKIPFFSTPVDLGKTYNKKRLFGSHKTIKGFVAACIFGVLAFALQKWLYQYPFFQQYSFIDYQTQSILFGLLFGFGAILGDLVKSFFKRRIGISEGKSWLLFDQLDFVIGAFAFSFIIFIPRIEVIIIIIVLTPILHMLAHYTGFLLGINKDKI